ncbi:MAG: glycosyltransferase family 4 protein, partial [Pedobacter sp.]|nr:glycosyltransferase family 4 protein [Chitinophagaceae bacterium]
LTVNFWFRNPLKEYFSIENVFNGVANDLQNEAEVSIQKKHVPFTSTSLKTVRKNIQFAAKNSSGINHVTGDIYYITPYLKGKKIITIHDFVLFRRTQNFFKKQVFKYLWYTQPIKAADIITVISPQIKKELLDLFTIDENKVKVIPNFYNPYYTSLKKITNQIENKILFIGDTENKNLTRVIEALHGLNIDLHIVGNPSINDTKLLAKNNIKYQLHINITDAELGTLYQTSSMLLFPSLYEGFGLPIIEAQAVGLPVITSNIQPMSWVASEAAILVNPNNVQAIREAVISVQNNIELVQQIVTNGFKNIQRFSLPQISQQYLQCYQQLQ